MRFVLVLSTILILTGAVTRVDAQQTLTMDQAVQMALQSNWSIAQSENAVETAHADKLSASGNYLPTVSLSAGWNRNQEDRTSPSTQVIDGVAAPLQSTFRVTNSFSTGVDAQYTIFDGLRREGTSSSASARATAAELNATRTKQSVVFQVERAYVNVLRAAHLVKVSEENLKRDQRQLERITESNKVGALSLADVYRQQSQVANDELDQITAQNNYDKAKADLIALIGGDVFENYNIADPSITAEISETQLAETRSLYANESELSKRALTARPDYLSSSEVFEASGSGVTAARSGYFPSVTAFAGYSLNNTEISTLPENKNINWGLNLRWNLFDGFQTNQALQSALASQRDAQISLKQAERDINVEVRKALLDLEAARKAYEVSQKGLVSAQQDHRIAEERYNLGAGTLLDLLVANAGLVNAQASRVNGACDYVIAKRNVEFVLGERTY